MLVLETQREHRAIGATAAASVTANGEASSGEARSSSGIQQHPPASELPSSLSLVHEDAAPAPPVGMDGDVWKCGYLRKQKHGHKRFFVLRGPSHSGPSRLEYYDSEKKFRNSVRCAASNVGSACPPKRVIYLYQCLTVNKRADAKNKYLIALYTKDEYFAMVAESEQEQDDWYLALSELMSDGRKGHVDADDLDDGYGVVGPGAVFKEVWQVNVKPKGLGQTKNLTGVHRLCLSSKTIHLMKLNSETPCVNLQLMNIRRCGHSESFFFIEVGRSSSIGPGEIWMQVDDSVVAQNMHETILETMKALKAFAEFRPRSKSQSSGSNPIAFITTRRHLGNLPPSQTGLQRRSRTETTVGTPPASKSAGLDSYRFRTSSEGEGTMSRPYRSVTGSLIHLNSARGSLGRQDGAGRYARALPTSNYHTRSASLPVSHFPSNSSPVSVSSSSGHGSASDTLTRPSSASICGSPSDGGFVSSDEYGSSPCDFRYFRVRSSTPDSLGNTPPIREENSLSDYMAMDRHCEAPSGTETPRDESTFEERPSRKLAYSSRPTGGSGVAPVYQKMTQTGSSLDESPSDSGSLGRKGPQTCLSPVHSGCGSCAKAPLLRADPQRRSSDDGYMPMMPGVMPSPSADYMPMQPSSQVPKTAPPSSHQTDTHGYMVMLPGSGCLPAQTSPHGSQSQLKDGEYMDMSQGGAAASQQVANEGYYVPTTPETPKSYSSYFSLPRSYKTPVRENHSEYVPMCSPVKPACTAGEFGKCGSPGGNSAPGDVLHNGCGEPYSSDRQAVRPTRLSLDGQRTDEAPECLPAPSSPGEYINIEFGDRPLCTPCSLSAEGSPSSLGSVGEHRRSPPHEDYMSLPKARSPRLSPVAPWNPPSYTEPVAPTAVPVTSSGHADNYTDMTFGLNRRGGDEAAQQHETDPLYSPLPPLSPQREPKVIRADPQARRRHSSETFSSPPGGTNGGSSATIPAPASPHLAEGARWHSSGSFDSVWLRMDAAAAPSPDPTNASCGPGRMCRNSSAGFQNGLNYIALDLRENPPPAPPSPTDNGAYASIDFSKAEARSSAPKD
ncbi:insulin receptor substrate 2-B-like [Arapaima gigas]